MAVGKTTIGRQLAEQLKVNFFDTDELIKMNTNQDITSIFSDYGEKHFRELEHYALKRLHNEAGIIATGGGILLNQKNIALLKQGIVILLNTKFDIQLKRASQKDRPLLLGDLKENLKNINNKRKPLYEKHADFIVSANYQDIAIKEITKILFRNKKIRVNFYSI